MRLAVVDAQHVYVEHPAPDGIAKPSSETPLTNEVWVGQMDGTKLTFFARMKRMHEGIHWLSQHANDCCCMI